MRVKKPNNEQKDTLRAEFTSWLTTLLQRARIDYLRRKEREVKMVSLDEVNEAALAVEDRYAALESAFEFEEERLAKAFFSLPIQRQQILTMMYVDQLSPEEIARILHCSVDHVYKTKSRSLNSLRKMLNDMGGNKMNLSAEEFRKILEGAVAGKHSDLETVLKLYQPLINRCSMVGGEVDEDLRQYLMIHIALNISKFIL